MSFYHLLVIVAVVAVVIFLVNKHYQKKGVPLEYAPDDYYRDSMSHRITKANAGVDDPYFKDSPD
jgi:hypothetical protein